MPRVPPAPPHGPMLSAPPEGPTPEPRAAPSLTDPWPFTGRGDELDRLERAITARRGGSVVIAGPAGVGKTRLAREAQRRAEAVGMATLWVTATPSVSRSPFGVFASLFGTVERAHGGFDGASTFDDLLHRFSCALVDRAAGGRLLLLVDDAHVLDEASAGLVHQLVATDVVRVVASVRTGEPVPEPITALWREDLAARLQIEGIAGDTVQALLSTVLGGQIDRATVEELSRHCRGNALFLRELTLGAVADGSLTRDVGVWHLTRRLTPSARIVELVEARLRDLDDEARAVLELVAYAEPLELPALAALADETTVAALERDGLLVATADDARPRIGLGHPVYGDVLRSRTGAMRVAAMARALAANAETGDGSSTDDALRAGIWRLDGGGGDPELLLAAGREARWRYDFRLAERLARAAVDAGAGFHAEMLAAQAVALQGDPDAAEAELERLATRAGNDADRARLGVVHVDCLWFHLGRMDDAWRVGRRAEDAIATGPLRDEVSGRLVGVALALEGPSAAVAMAEPLLARAEGRALGWLGVVSSYALGRLGRLAEALEAADLGYRAAVQSDERDDLYPWFNLYARCEALVRGGRFREAEALAREQYGRGLQERSSEARAWFLWHLCQSVRERGDAHAAVRDAREALTLFVELGRGGFQDSLRCALAQGLALSGDHRGAERVLAALNDGDHQAQWSSVDLLSARAWTAAAGGATATARDLLTEAADLGVRIGDRTGASAALHDVARLGAPATALPPLASLGRRIEGDLAPARVAHVEALCAGDPDALERCAATFEELGANLLAAEAAAEAAVARRGRARDRAADAALHRAATLAARCPGAATPALLPIAWREQLTPAERETALLAAAGRSNLEIAAELQLSVRTVGNRLYRIYPKLGVTRRDELARVLR